ncbi:MAG: ABC transporter substrate-binding protein [Prevotellaceae bacterium]|jgi:iron complex transport system substrate-binding protein|nr:ABC transporter substrate-binding protein [Prevotellaceae bacterium]
MKKELFISCFLLLLFACNTGRKTNNLKGRDKIYEPKYAKGFSLYQKDKSLILSVVNPWQYASEIEINYVLKNDASPDIMNEIKIPVEKAVCMSTTHVAFISVLGKTSSITGVSGLKHVSDSAVNLLGKENKIIEVGYDSNLSYESVYSLAPDVVFAYGVAGEFAAVEKKLNELGVKVVYIGEYLEDTPLGKAEWIVAMSAFFADIDTAVKIFEKIETGYESIKETVSKTEYKPLVMMNIPYKDVWYLPGTLNYMVRFIEDAGGKYIYPENNKRESIPMSIEKAFEIAQNADFWLIGNTPKNLEELREKDPRMADIPSFKNRKVFNSNLRDNGFGDDFWESGIVKPDIILKDLIKIFHPELLPEYDLYYYRHLK